MDIKIRTYQPDDLPDLLGLINRSATYDKTDTHTTFEELRARFERPYFHPEHNCLIATLTDGTLIGHTTTELDPRVGKGWGDGCIDPAYRRQGIGTALIQAADARHVARGQTEVASDLPLTITRNCRDTMDGAHALLEGSGYAVKRVAWFMHMAFDGPIEPPPLPARFTLRPFERERDAHAIWQAEQDLFRDSEGFIEPPYEVWVTLMFPPNHDDRLWLAAMDDATDSIAGLCLCWPKSEDPATGWVETLGVYPAYRNRGLGTTLLLQGLATLQAHGLTAAELAVDSENTTNAAALYERVGMSVKRRYLIFQKSLR